MSRNPLRTIYLSDSESRSVPLSRVNPELPAEFDLILAKALEKDPELRCQSAAELRADLKRLKREAESDRTHLSDLYLLTD
jgi:serine/threonine protein kinase